MNPLYKIEKEGIIEKIDAKKYADSEPLPLPEGFEWADVDPENDQHMEEINEFLNNFYVESESKDFKLGNETRQLKWAYSLPGYKKEYFVCIRSSKT